jgi:Flp pilus assembly pilin Flp
MTRIETGMLLAALTVLVVSVGGALGGDPGRCWPCSSPGS